MIEPMNATQGKILIDGNSATALGALFAGVTVVAWYPITPSTSVVEDLIDYMKQYRVEKDGKASFAVVQAEDELAAIGMVLGAGWAGARAMTASSGPGFSLMTEFAGLGYYAEIPGVIVDVQRTGPSTGLPTRTSQADLQLHCGPLAWRYQARHAAARIGEGVLRVGMEAFDLAEQLQTPVFVLSDLDLGMNNWMSEPFDYPEKPLNRGKVLNAQQLEELGGFARYKDVDGDGIGYRTLPGTDHPSAAYFTRGTGHNEKALYSERPEDYENNMLRLARKFETAKTLVPKPILEGTGGQKVGIIAFGTSHWAVIESRDQLERESGLATDYLRIRAFPFTQEVADFVASHERIYVVEQNRDAQMLSLLKIDLDPADAVKLHSVLHFNGLPIDAHSVTNAIAAQEGATSHYVHHARTDHPGSNCAARQASQDQPHRPCDPGLPRRQEHAVRRLRTQRRLRAHHRGLLRDGHPARARDEDERHRLLVQIAGVLHVALLQLQLGAWPHALGGHGRAAGQQDDALDRPERRRRHRVDRHGPVHPPAAAQCADDLHCGRQRRLWADQGPVLRHRRHRLQAEERRGQRASRHRHLRAGHPDRAQRLSGAPSPATRSSSPPC